MKSQRPGKSTSDVEVTNISSNGFWLLSNQTELFLSFEDFPWFADAPVSKITNVEQPQPGHYFWPDLDIDLSDEIIQNPSKFPLSAS